MASIPQVDDGFEMGRVVSRAFGALSRNIVLYLGMTVLLVSVPSLLVSFVIPKPTDAASIASGSYLWWIGLISLIGFFSNFVLLAALTYATVTDMNNERPTFAKALGVGMRYVLPLLALSIVSVLGIYFAMILLIIPGVIVAVMWSVAAPAMVTENLGVFASLGRSRALTKGWRWRIFALLLVAVILTFVPVTIIPLLTGAFEMDPAAALNRDMGLLDVVNALLGAVATMVLIAIVAATYAELRAIKEGASTESLASIFA